MSEKKSAITRIDLLRHGEPIGGRRYRGQIDDPLSDKGWQQMWAAVEGQGPWQKIITSPLQRCSAFAEALAEQLAIPFHSESRIKEVGFGVWEGRGAQELRDDDPTQLHRFYHDPVGARPDGAEPLHEFVDRVAEVMVEILSAPKGDAILVIAHSGVIRAAIAHVLQLPISSLYRIFIPSAGIVRIELDNERPPTLVFPSRS